MSDRGSGAEAKRSLGDRLLVLYVVLGIFVLGVVYGIGSQKYKYFPYQWVKEAITAAKAVIEVEKDDLVNLPASFKAFEDNPGPHVTDFRSADPNRTGDWVLVTGGPYEFLDQCPTFGCLAWVMDRDGKVVHSWEIDLDQLWSNTEHINGFSNPWNFKVLGLELLEDGGLIAAFHNNFAFPEGAGLARFDIDGELVWYSRDHSHHWFTTDDQGRIYTPAHRVVEPPYQVGKTKTKLNCRDGKSQFDTIHIFDPDGRLLEEIDVSELLVENGFEGLLQGTQDRCDPLHMNFVQYIDSDYAGMVDGVDEGDLLLSLRDINTLAVLDPRTRKFKWMSSGMNIRQHSPRLAPDGSILVFDNVGGDATLGGSQITRQWIGNDDIETLFPTGPLPDGHPFFSQYAGYIDISADGKRALVSVTEHGDIMEIELESGELLWQYEKVFPSQNYPGKDPEDGPAVRVEAFGANYVDAGKFAGVLTKQSESQ